MNVHTRWLHLFAVALVLSVNLASQSATPQRKSPGAKPLSFFVGSWVTTNSSEENAPECGGKRSTQTHLRIVVAPLKPDELEVTETASKETRLDSDTINCNPRLSNIAQTIKGRVLKADSDFKFIYDSGTCEIVNENVSRDGSYHEQRVGCTPDQRTYTIKVLSQDSIVLVYKPTGEQSSTFQRE